MSLQRDRDADVGSLAAVKAALDARTRELAEAHDREAATAEVLKAISSTSDLQRVLDTLLETACRLCEADIGTIRYEEGEGYRLAATFGCRPEWREHFAGYSTKPDRTSVFGKTILDGSTVHIPDVLEDPEYARPVAQKLMGLRAALGVPLVRAGKTFGVISLFGTTPRPFTAKQIALLETFADQAEIAIENARLLSELRARTDDLTESLERQTATADVLKVISRSAFDLQRVFEALVGSAARLCRANKALILRMQGDSFQIVASYGFDTDYLQHVQSIQWKVDRHSTIGRAALERAVVHIPDVLIEADYKFSEAARRGGFRTVLGVPFLREGEPIGGLFLARPEVDPFSQGQIELLSTFAAQAVIAIENTRLLSELRETLERQTATSEVLQVISSSPGELKPVLS